MANEPFQDNSVLLKMYRQYGKDETTSHLFDEIRKLQFQLGEMKSAIAELEDEKEKLNRKITGMKNNLSPDESALLKTERKKYSAKCKEVIDWRNKYFSLQASILNQKKV